jgi:AcrR family transcriptional regulator
VRRSRLPRAERERQTLDAARRLFAERGYAAVTMDEVAADVGVTKPLLYNYFGNKDGLAIALVGPAGEALTERVVEAVEGAASPAEALRAGVRAFFAFVERDRASWRVLFDPTLPASGEIAARLAAARARLTAIIAALQLERIPPHARERARPEVEALSAALLGAAEAMARWWLAQDDEPLSATAAADLLISTIAPGLQELAAAPDPHTS